MLLAFSMCASQLYLQLVLQFHTHIYMYMYMDLTLEVDTLNSSARLHARPSS